MSRILVIDDDMTSNKKILQWLSAAGFEAGGADNGEAGLRLYMQKQFDLIITEIVIPEKDGLETILSIRKESRTVPIIAISGSEKVDPELYLELAKAFGADHTFLKPLCVGPFLSAIRECLCVENN